MLNFLNFRFFSCCSLYLKFLSNSFIPINILPIIHGPLQVTVPSTSLSKGFLFHSRSSYALLQCLLVATITIAATELWSYSYLSDLSSLSMGGFQISYMVLYHVIYSYAVLKPRPVMHSKFPNQDTKDNTVTHAKGGKGNLLLYLHLLQKPL